MAEPQATQRDSSRSKSIVRTASGLIPADADERAAGDSTLIPVLVKASGVVVTDVDGNEYVDFVCGHGSLLLGHGDERIVAAITKSVAKGCSLGNTTETRIRLAELIAARIPSIDMIQYAPSRYHAVREVARLARQQTERHWIVIPEGSGSRRALLDDEQVVAVPRDLDRLQKIAAQLAEPPAAVIIEPVGTDVGLHPPTEMFLRGLRAWCDEHGALLAFDEAVTAFRLAPGGASTLYDVHPDVTCFGTSVTGGMGVAAYGGRRELMRDSAADATVHVSLSEVGDEPSFAAGVAFLQATAEDGFHEALDRQAQALADDLISIGPRPRVGITVQRVGSIVGLTVTPQVSENSFDADAVISTYHGAMLDHGVLVSPQLSSCLFVSTAHRDEHVTRAVEGLDRALRAINDSLAG